MAQVSALLAQYLSVKAQIGTYQLEATKWANLHENMSAKLSRQTSAEGSWESSSMSYEDNYGDTSKEIKIKGGTVVKPKSSKQASIKEYKLENGGAAYYASIMVPHYDPNKLEEYAELDIEYDMMQSTYDTLLEQLNAQAETLKSTLSEATKDTGMLES